MDIHKEVKNQHLLNAITPAIALNMLKEGNLRFLEQNPIERDHNWHIRKTIDGQHPFALIHSCIDSRVMPSIIFDQGIGDLFISRIAGNIISKGILGSMEYACAITGSKLIVVLGHSSCGAIHGACNNIQLGNLSSSLRKIHPAIDKVRKSSTFNKVHSQQAFEDEVALQNIKISIEYIKSHSEILNKMLSEKKIDIIGGFYHHDTGEVEFC